jgi:hypothetical protein
MRDRAKNGVVVTLILFPLFLTAIFKYGPSLRLEAPIETISILPPRIVTPAGFSYLEQDVVGRLTQELSDLPGIRVQRSPSRAEVEQSGKDLAAIAKAVEADALILTSVTVDAGIIQLGVQVIDTRTDRSIYNNPYQSPKDRYEEMVRAAAAGIRRAIARKAKTD